MPAPAVSIAAQAIAATPVPSPCNAICRMDARNGLCEGCFRTIDEIMAWSSLPDDEKRAVWARIERRRAG
jgi:predicted Fe-S protein YdhL (DUF1289 family)